MAQTSNAVRELAGISLFADLSQPELEAVARIFGEEVFDAGRRVLHEGFQGSNFYVIVEGEAETRSGGSERRLSAGDFFGETAILLGTPPSEDVVALTPLRCRVLPSQQLQKFLMDHPEVMYRMLQQLALTMQSDQRGQG